MLKKEYLNSENKGPPPSKKEKAEFDSYKADIFSLGVTYVKTLTKEEDVNYLRINESESFFEECA